MDNIVRTVYSSYLQTCGLLKLPFELKPNTTLNEKFNIQSGVSPTADQIPTLGYFAIGNGGHKYVTGAGGISVPEPVQHRATDAALFNHLPFVLREPELDLSPAQRTNYALRKQVTYNGKSYWAYYLKRFTRDNVKAAMEYRVVNNGVTVTSPFVPNSSNLNPTPPDLNPSGVNVVTGDYVASTAKFELNLTEEDVAELLHVAEVMYDDDAYAIISEIGLCTGVDKIVGASGVSGNFNFTEAIAVQIATFVSIHSAVKFSSNGVQILLDVGASEPLFSLK